LRRTTSFDVLSVKIGLTDSPVGELKNQKSVVNFEQEVYILPIWGAKTPWTDWAQFFGGRGPRRNQPFKFGDDRFRGLGSGEGQSLPFPIDFEGHPYNTHTIVWGVISTLDDFRSQYCNRSRSNLGPVWTLITSWKLAVKRRVICQTIQNVLKSTQIAQQIF